ncbi:SH3 domain-containing protein, partial [Streptantibioticus ferralitis]
NGDHNRRHDRDHNRRHDHRRKEDRRQDNRRHHHYRGRIIAHSGLNVRQRPTTHSRIVGWHAHGSIVSIRCMVRGESINGNSRWYRMTDGKYGWSSGRYIHDLGRTPRWCTHNAHTAHHGH